MVDKNNITNGTGVNGTYRKFNQDLTRSSRPSCENKYVNDGFVSGECKNKNEYVSNLNLVNEMQEERKLKETGYNKNFKSKQEKIESPDGGWGWVVCFACFMQCLLYDGITYTFGFIFLELTDTFNCGKGPGAWISSLELGLTMACGPLISIMCDRMGLRMVTITGAITACCGLVMSSFAQSIQFLFFSYGIVLGIGCGMTYQSSFVAVTIYFTKKRTFATGLSVCGNGMGIFLLSPLTEWLLQTYSWRGTFLIQGGLLLNGVLCGLVYRPLISTSPVDESALPNMMSIDSQVTLPTVSRRKSVQDGNKNAVNMSDVSQSSNSLSTDNKKFLDVITTEYCVQNYSSYRMTTKDEDHWTKKKAIKRFAFAKDICINGIFNVALELIDMSLLKKWKFCLYVVSSAFFQLSLYIPFIFLPDLAKHAGIDPSSSAWLVSTIGVTSLVSRILFSRLTDRFEVNRMLVYSVCLFVGGMAVLAKPWFSSFEGLLTLSIIFGLSEGLAVVFVYVLIPDLVGTENLSKAFGIRNMFSGISVFFGTPIAGWLFDLTGSYDVSFYVFGSTLAVSGAMLFLIPVIDCFHHTKA